MESKTRAKYQARAKIIKALAHPTRLFIIDELAKGERCVCELTEMIGADMSTVSRHLSALSSVGIIEADRRGSNIYYGLKAPCLLRIFSCVEETLRLKAQEQLQLSSPIKGGSCS